MPNSSASSRNTILPPLAAAFELSEHSGGLVSTRIKMGKTSPVHAVIKAGDTVYRATKEVKVTIGGCGG